MNLFHCRYCGALMPPIAAHYELSPRAEKVLANATRDADGSMFPWVEVEYLLASIIMLKEGVARSILLRMGIDLDSVIAGLQLRGDMCQLDNSNRPIEREPSDIPFSPGAKWVMTLAYQESEDLDDLYVGTEHLLLGILSEGGSRAARILVSMGVDLARTRRAMLYERGLHPILQKESDMRSSALGKLEEEFRELTEKMFTQAVEVLKTTGSATISDLQRRLHIGRREATYLLAMLKKGGHYSGSL